MIEPITSAERDYTYALAAMELRARAQDAAGDTEGAITLSQARRDLMARGGALHGARNAGLVEFADVLAGQDEKPQAFFDFLARQDAVLAAAKDAKREKVAEPDPVVVEPEAEPEPVEPKPAPRRRTTKKES